MSWSAGKMSLCCCYSSISQLWLVSSIVYVMATYIVSSLADVFREVGMFYALSSVPISFSMIISTSMSMSSLHFDGTADSLSRPHRFITHHFVNLVNLVHPIPHPHPSSRLSLAHFPHLQHAHAHVHLRQSSISVRHTSNLSRLTDKTRALLLG